MKTHFDSFFSNFNLTDMEAKEIFSRNFEGSCRKFGVKITAVEPIKVTAKTLIVKCIDSIDDANSPTLKLKGWYY
jgi:hypothetical protein